MAETRNAGLDFSEVRFRSESIAGVKLTLVICAAGCRLRRRHLGEPGAPAHIFRSSLWAQQLRWLFILIPHERVVRSRGREPFFFLWSFMNIGLAAGLRRPPTAGRPARSRSSS